MTTLHARIALLATSAALIAGCVTAGRFNGLAVGTPEAEARGSVGEPIATYALPNGGRRLEYPMGVLQQETYMVDIDAQGRVSQVQQVRTLKRFSALRIGVDTQDDVRREFGTPWRIDRYALSPYTTLLYPHPDGEQFNTMVGVYVDAQGIVRSVDNGPDPRLIPVSGADKD